MKQVKVEWNYGQFRVSAVANVSEELEASILRSGVLQVLQRGPATAAEKQFWGDKKRPDGFERDGIAFSDENAIKIAEGFGSEAVVKDETGTKLKMPFVISDVSARPEAEKAEKKFAAAQKIVKGKGGDPTRLGDLAEKVGFEYEDESELTVENVEFLQAIDEYVNAI